MEAHELSGTAALRHRSRRRFLARIPLPRDLRPQREFTAAFFMTMSCTAGAAIF